jgi:urease accessory protein
MPADRVIQPSHAQWVAQLELGFARHADRTVLHRRRHEGPLRVQRPFYPEGEAVCHVIVIHPPGGIANGDALSLSANLQAGSHALLTTPGAGKWYRSEAAWAHQRTLFRVEPGACLEWLPQETIVFDGARADMSVEIDLAANARYIGWELLCLGRPAAGESFRTGRLRLRTRLRREGRLIWLERGRFAGGSSLLHSPVGLAGHVVCGTLVAAAPEIDQGLAADCRRLEAREAQARTGVTLLPGLLVARYLGDCTEAAGDWLTTQWRRLRPALLGRVAQPPRIWNT